MPATDRNHGQYGQVLADPTGGATAVQLVSLNKWDLDLSTDKQKVTCFEDPNHVYVQGKPDIKGSFAGEYDKSAAGLILFDMILGTVAPFFKMIPNRLSATQFFSGKGWIDGKISVDSNGGVTTSGAFVAADAWTTPVDPA
jgi:hypothetical protein